MALSSVGLDAPPGGDYKEVLLDPRAIRAPSNTTAYVNALRETAVVLAPGGDDHETFRFWEALAAGAIPVTVAPSDGPEVDFVRTPEAFFARGKSAAAAGVQDAAPRGAAPGMVATEGRNEGSFAGSWGRQALCPLPVLSSWRELPAFLERLFANGGQYADALQMQTARCYAEIVEDAKADMRSAVKELLTND